MSYSLKNFLSIYMFAKNAGVPCMVFNPIILYFILLLLKVRVATLLGCPLVINRIPFIPKGSTVCGMNYMAHASNSITSLSGTLRLNSG
jgi:hypothetical protein